MLADDKERPVRSKEMSHNLMNLVSLAFPPRQVDEMEEPLGGTMR